MADQNKLWLNWHRYETKVDDDIDDIDDRDITALYKFQSIENDQDKDIVCAICGYRTVRWVKDHCHESGLIRGLLCSGCNTHEGMSNNPVYQAYRKVYPTKILKQKIHYADYATGYPPNPYYTRKEVENVDSWTPEACFRAMKDFNENRVSLDWLTRSQLNKVISNAINFAAETGSNFYDTPSDDRVLAESVANYLLGKK